MQKNENDSPLETSEHEATPYQAPVAKELTAWSANGEEFNADSLEDLLDMNDELTIGSKVYFGVPEYPSTTQLCDADDVIEMIGERAYDLAGEYADGFPDVADEARAELDTLLAAWISKHCQPTFYTVSQVQSRLLTALDFPDGHDALAQEGGA